jgi:hypothetical protein
MDENEWLYGMDENGYLIKGTLYQVDNQVYIFKYVG